jgi:hypothetical protein
MKQTLRALLTAALAAASLQAIAGDVTGLPKKVSQLNGWHGTRIQGCELIFAPDFGKKPSEVNLLEELQRHYYDMKFDVACDVMADVTALDQLAKVAVQDQSRDAARLIVLGPYNGKLFLDGDLAESYGETYLYPVLLKYNDLEGLRIPKEKETKIAYQICMTAYNPSTGGDFSLDKLVTHLKEKKLHSLVNAISRQCAQVQKDVGE